MKLIKLFFILMIFGASLGIVSGQLPLLQEFFQQIEETPTEVPAEIDLTPLENMMDMVSSDLSELKSLPAPVITVVTPEYGGFHDMYTIGVATTLGNRMLHEAENIVNYISSHFSAAFGAGAGAIVSATLGVGVNIYDITKRVFEGLRYTVWRVRVVPCTELKTKSPIMITVSGPAVNSYTAEINNQLAVRFVKENGVWVLKDTRTGKVYRGHYGIFVIKPKKRLSELKFTPEELKGELKDINKVNIVLAGLDRQGTLAVGRMLELATTGRISNVNPQELVNSISSWIFSAMLLTENMQKLLDMTSKASQYMPGRVEAIDPQKAMKELDQGITVIVKANEYGYPVWVEVLNYA